MNIEISTNLGKIIGNDREFCHEFLGIPFAKAKRFEYAEMVEKLDSPFDATKFGNACVQTRTYFEHLEVPERMFYHKEFRKGLKFNYSEDCLNLNIYTPKKEGKYPVIVYIHGGGFNSGATSESYLDGECYAKRGVILVTIHYRVGVLGYLTHEEIYKKYGKDGNFGLNDQFVALNWVKKNIASFGGDENNITLLGQSAGAISIQFLSLSPKCVGLYQRAIMLSGGGKFPNFALPRPCETTREYWLQLMELAGCKTFEEFKTIDDKRIFEAVEEIKKLRKDTTYNTMPVIDKDLIADRVDLLIKNPNKIDYMIGYTNRDMFALIMSMIGHKYARQNNAYLYYFDIDAPGEDKNYAFHSSDLRYVFHTLDKSFRNYSKHDYEVSDMMIDYISNFAKTGNPNAEGLPLWKRGKGRALCISKKVKMGIPNRFKLLSHTLKGDPK